MDFNDETRLMIEFEKLGLNPDYAGPSYTFEGEAMPDYDRDGWVAFSPRESRLILESLQNNYDRLQ